MPQGVRHGEPGDVVHGVPLEEGLPTLPRLTPVPPVPPVPRSSLLLAHFALEVPSRPPSSSAAAPGPPRTQGTAPPESFMHTAPPLPNPAATELVLNPPPPSFFSPFENKLNLSPPPPPRPLPAPRWGLAGGGAGCSWSPHLPMPGWGHSPPPPPSWGWGLPIAQISCACGRWGLGKGGGVSVPAPRLLPGGTPSAQGRGGRLPPPLTPPPGGF